MLLLEEFTGLMKASGQRFHFIGSNEFGAVASLDREGRLFTVLGGKVVSRVDAEGLRGVSTRERYCNPGGDVLWPAPEGTCLGYEYSAGNWRVPPGITGARYIVKSKNENLALIEAEIDLINNIGTGLPCLFGRGIELDPGKKTMLVHEKITYIGRRRLERGEFMLAPWSLSQFDNAHGAEAVFPDIPGTVRDLYAPSGSIRSVEGGLCRARTDKSMGYQIALSPEVEWIEYRNPSENLVVRRSAGRISGDLEYTDIIDAPPEEMPGKTGARFSVYNDIEGFMEIEAAGGCPPFLERGTAVSLEVTTTFISGKC